MFQDKKLLKKQKNVTLNRKNNIMAKKILFNGLYIANIILVLLTVILPILKFVGVNELYYFLVSDTGFIVRGILSLMVFVIWIYLIYIWAKHDKKALRLVLLIFLSAFYIIFYYIRAVRNKWI
jgi:hypothetical protein